MENDETKRLELRKSVQYNAGLSQFLMAYGEILEKQLLDNQYKVNFKGLYKNAKLLWLAAHELKYHQNPSVEEVIYLDFQKLLSSKKKIDIKGHRAKKKAEYREEAFDKFLVSYIERKYLKIEAKHKENSANPKPTMRMAYFAYKKKLKKMKCPTMSVGAIKQQYKRLTSKSES